jgi:hypothetical protein
MCDWRQEIPTDECERDLISSRLMNLFKLTPDVSYLMVLALDSKVPTTNK